MLLLDYIQIVYVPIRIEIARRYRTTLESTARNFSDLIGHPSELADLTESNVCAYLTNCRKTLSARSVNNHRQALMSVWQDVADSPKYARMLVEQPNLRRIRKLKEDPDPPICFRKRHIKALVQQCESLSGMVGDVPASLWWLSLVLGIHWTSSRIGAMLAVRSADYDGRGILIRKQKNKRPQWYPLPKSARLIIESTHPESRQMMWASPWCIDHLWVKARKIFEDAGLPCPKGRRNLFHKIRRTTITYCAQADPAIAQRTAGHRDYATTLRSYVDQTLVRQPAAADVLFDPLKPTRRQPRPPRHPARLRIVG